MWFKVDDKLHDHRKVLRLLRISERRPDPAAMGLWVLAGTWCADNRTDGFVPDYMLDRWDADGADHAAQLVKVGLWELDQVEGEDGYRFHDWSNPWQPTKAKLEADEESHRRTVELHRDPQLVAALRERDKDRCRYCGVAVNFKDRRSTTGGTYDHVDPEGPNSLGNVVVACRGCNSTKARRTPEQAGMRLLKPGSLGPSRLRQVVSRSEQIVDLDTGQVGQGSRPGGVGSGSGLVGSGADPDLSTDLDTGTDGAP